MKIITDYFASPPAKHKKCNSADILPHSKNSECNPISTLEDSSYYQTRKIKIRLADPNVPDSYVCEIYDTSIEEENIPNTTNELDKNCAFNILMAGRGRETKNSVSKKRTRQNPLADLPGADSSDDESLIFVKKRLKISMIAEKTSTSDHDKKNKIEKSTLSTDSEQLSNKDDQNVSTKNSKRRSLRKKVSVENLQATDLIERKKNLKKTESRSTPVCDLTDSEVNQNTLRGKRSKKSDGSIEKYFMSSNKSLSRKGKSKCNQEYNSVIELEGYEEPSTVKVNREINDLKNGECFVVLEKKSIAPMFLKNSKKSAVDPDILKARQEFLRKGLPNVLAKKMSKEKIEETSWNFFPLISHVHQSSDNPLWKKRIINVTLNDIGTQYNPELCWKSCLNSQISIINLKNKVKKAADAKTHLNNLTKIHKNMEITKLYDVLTNINESYNNNQIYTIWSNKYKLKSSDFLSNEQTIAKLENWLLSWKKYGDNIRNGPIKQCESSDDFISSDEDDQQSNVPITSCLLQGPISSGKTALVQALAAELDFHILEVNCSTKRSGKRMLADLQEATKSHKILQEANGNVGTSLKGEKMAMIVVEEADIIFEDHDDGFIFGLQTLINSARRPVLLLTSEPSTDHLDKFRSSQTLQLKLVRPQLTSSCAFLELVALVEGSIVPRSAILKMLALNNCDLRQCLLQLQFWIQHGGHKSTWPIISNQRFTTGSMWWLSHQLLFQSDLWHSGFTSPRQSEEKISNKSNEEPSKSSLCKVESMQTRYDYFETLSLCDLLQGNAVSSNLEISNFEKKIKDSSYLGETLLLEHSKQKMFKNELIEEILQTKLACIQIDKSAINLQDMPLKDKRWLTSQRKASNELGQVVPNRYSNIARYCDYLPSLREICRAEQSREVGNTKRRNRFYHYIKSLGGSPTPANLNINCSVLFEK